MTQVNFSELFELHRGAGDPPPDGIYDCVCTKAEAVMSSTGKPMIRAVFRVLTGSEANKTVTDHIVLTKDNSNAFWMFVRKLSVFGLGQDVLTQVSDLQQIAPQLVNKQVRLTIQKQPNRDLPNVNKYEAIPGGILSAAPQGAVPQMPTPTPAPAPQPQFTAPPVPTLPTPEPQAPPVPQYVPPAPAPVLQDAPAPQEAVAPPVPQTPAPPVSVSEPAAPPQPQVPVPTPTPSAQNGEGQSQVPF